MFFLKHKNIDLNVFIVPSLYKIQEHFPPKKLFKGGSFLLYNIAYFFYFFYILFCTIYMHVLLKLGLELISV